MVKLLKHQKEFIKRNPKQSIMAWGTRVGKSYAIAFWLKNYPDTDFILICPKRIKKQWQEILKECEVVNTEVATKEEAKKIDLNKYGGLVCDEAHHISKGLYEKPSQITRTVYEWKRTHTDSPILLATATPIRSSPANLHTLATFAGIFWEWKTYRAKYYHLARRPYVPRPFWDPVKDWRILIQQAVRNVCDIIALSDITEVPEQRHHIVKVKLFEQTEKAIKNFSDESAVKEWYGRHKLAQREEKLEKIKELSENEAKVIVACKYREQIDFYEKELKKEREVIILTGGVKDQMAAIQRAMESLECYFIIQTDCGEGFRGDSFSLLIFASMSWSFVAYEQMLGRMLHLEKKHSNDFYYLLADEKDKIIYKRIMLGKDFSIAEIAKSKKAD